MKAHIGADADSGLVHSVTCTAANVADITETGHLLHGEEAVLLGDTGAEQREEPKDCKAKFHSAMKRGKLEAMAEGPLKALTKRAETLQARIRARVEHPFHVVKNLFRHRKVRDRSLAKNRAQCQVLVALANLVVAKQALLA